MGSDALAGAGAQRGGRPQTGPSGGHPPGTTIAGLLGKIHDLEADLPEDGVQRLITENTTLKQNVRQLTQDIQRLNERLQGARDNNRFLDKRIADLEAQLVADSTDLGIRRTTNTRSQREMSASRSTE